jgi:hypothetical protein
MAVSDRVEVFARLAVNYWLDASPLSVFRHSSIKALSLMTFRDL